MITQGVHPQEARSEVQWGLELDTSGWAVSILTVEPSACPMYLTFGYTVSLFGCAV